MQYEIKGGNLPVVICRLNDGETMIGENGAMSWMSPNIKFETKGGGAGKALGRMFAGESLFQNFFTAENGNGMIAYASDFPGEIRPFEISPGNELICQKGVFLAGESGINLSVFFQKKLGAGLFGGEGFIMLKLSGNGTAFCDFNGSIIEYELQAGQQIIIDTGHLAAMSASCQMDIRSVPGLKNKFLGGEGLFNTIVTGPGHVWLHTMPLSNVANVLRPYIATGN